MRKFLNLLQIPLHSPILNPSLALYLSSSKKVECTQSIPCTRTVESTKINSTADVELDNEVSNEWFSKVEVNFELFNRSGPLFEKIKLSDEKSQFLLLSLLLFQSLSIASIQSPPHLQSMTSPPQQQSL